MLKLVNIKKEYIVGDSKVHALKGIDLAFRKSEFVSILGPSGCGKTTLLNLIGGLDQATFGDIKINEISTKDYKDRDWDLYRNHRVGFVFQSYNLIPHQTVLGNVELALTIAGLDKQTRTNKAKAALDKVGLSDQYYKRPNQLSGGQSQRVAIARALVNDPEILLADEPTGALDTVTSKQIMDLIKEISKDRLVIMVTHNPDLAQEYSTRIIRLLDGNLTDDSNPYEGDVLDKEKGLTKAKGKKKTIGKEKAKMSFWTAFRLSLQNLVSKKRRTIMTVIAGSIGIIGVSLVLAISFGLQGYIDNMQEDMLSGNPITIEKSTFDINQMTDFTVSQEAGIVKEAGYVNVTKMIKELNERLSAMENIFVQNTITKDYVTYLKDFEDTNSESLSAITYNYGLDVGSSIYTNFKKDDDDSLNRYTSLSAITATYTSLLEQTPEFSDYAKIIGSLQQPFAQSINNKDYIESQYNLLYGNVATGKNEIMVVLNKDRSLSDLLLAQLGYYSQEEFIDLVNLAIGDEDYENQPIDYQTLYGKEFVWYSNNNIFNKEIVSSNPTGGKVPYTYNPYVDNNFSDGEVLTIVGIIEPKDNISYGSLTSGLYYTEALAEHIINTNYLSQIATDLRDNMLEAYSGSAFISKRGEPYQTIENGVPVTKIREEDFLLPTSGDLISYEYDYTIDGETHSAIGLIGSENQTMSLFGMTGSGDANMPIIISVSNEQIGGHVDVRTETDGDSSKWVPNLDDNKPFLLPASISIYAKDLKVKDEIITYLDAWNSNETITLSNNKVINADDRERIVYADLLSLVMGMIGSLIQIITIALIGFTSLSLIVSSVMIGIITYVSVVERIKEIGVIRSLGGRKRDVSNLFMAETFIIGLASGVFGIGITYLLSLIINLIVSSVSVVSAIAILPWYMALIMILISVLLTLVSGLMPSRSAARKDPAVALRAE